MDNVVIKKIYSFLKEDYKDDEDFEFPQEFLESGFIESEIDDYFEIYEDYSPQILIEMFLQLSYYSYKRFIYTFFENQNKLNQNDELTRAVYFAYIGISLGSKICKCVQGNMSIKMNSISFLLGINFLCNTDDESSEMGDYLINSLNAKNCIIGRGDAQALKSWFVIELH